MGSNHSNRSNSNPDEWEKTRYDNLSYDEIRKKNNLSNQERKKEEYEKEKKNINYYLNKLEEDIEDNYIIEDNHFDKFLNNKIPRKLRIIQEKYPPIEKRRLKYTIENIQKNRNKEKEIIPANDIIETYGDLYNFLKPNKDEDEDKYKERYNVLRDKLTYLGVGGKTKKKRKRKRKRTKTFF
jgi:hypothetical protein